MDGYTCLDLGAPQYSHYNTTTADDAVDTAIIVEFYEANEWMQNQILVFGLILLAIFCWLGYCARLSFGLSDRVLDPATTRDPASEEMRPEALKKRAVAVGTAWILLAIELGVATYLFFEGDGRVSTKVALNTAEYPLLPSEYVCEEGPQLVSYATFYKHGVAVVSQLGLWGLGGGTELPERVFLKLIAASVASCTGDASWSHSFSYPTQWAPILLLGLSAHMIWPLVVDVMALCIFESVWTQVGFYAALATLVACCNCTCVMAPGEGGGLFVVDALFTGVLGTLANFVQSDLLFAAVFAALPAFEVIFSVADIFGVWS